MNHEWIKNGHALPNNHILVAIKDPRSANNVIGTSINIISQARGGVGELSLKNPQSSGMDFGKTLEKYTVPPARDKNRHIPLGVLLSCRKEIWALLGP